MPPDDFKVLPFTASQADKARVWVSLLLRPLVCPKVPGHRTEKRMEIRFFAPGSMVGNLDFLERIFRQRGRSLPSRQRRRTGRRRLDRPHGLCDFGASSW
jgi:hypothetical protein